MLKAIEIDPKVKEALRIDPALVVRQKPGKVTLTMYPAPLLSIS